VLYDRALGLGSDLGNSFGSGFFLTSVVSNEREIGLFDLKASAAQLRNCFSGRLGSPKVKFQSFVHPSLATYN
jgi:hypothetical protein